MNTSRMKRSRAEGIRTRRDAGFSMTALVIFLTAASIMLTISVPSYVMQARREKEKELIFRGEEYARAIQKYQRTLNLLPTSIDELLSSNGTRFLRKEYADPITGEPWRPIILNSDGTLTGSNIYQNMGQVPTTTSVRNTAPATPATGAGAPRTGGTSAGTSMGSLGTTNPITSPGTGGFGGAGGAGLGGAGGGLGGAGTGVGGGAAGGGTARPATTGATPATAAPVQPQQQATPLTGIVGVGSNSKGTGVLVYEKQEQYSNWEFLAQLQQRNVPGAGGGGGGAPAPGGGGGAPAPGGGGGARPPAGGAGR